MEPFIRHTGIAAPLDQADVNTDMIFPQRFLRRPRSSNLAECCFHSVRHRPDGSLDPAFILNRPPYDRASVLVAGRNFGSGSSREHAPWTLYDFGFRALLSPLFADIFKNNCLNNGIVPATLPEADIRRCLAAASDPRTAEFTVDLEACEVRNAAVGTLRFEIADADRRRLLQGIDEIDETLGRLPQIERHEQEARASAPWNHARSGGN
ncbi:3-isopropylmalate dehydratase small subunit [Allostella vacuolata]|nr:3-isopropylmalate dehydratase small subunit [Stella vacuolata]